MGDEDSLRMIKDMFVEGYHKIGICREAGFEGAPAAMKVVPPACRKAKAHYKGGNDGDEDKDGAN